MTKLDPIYILKLINASELLSDAQKEAIKKKLPVFTVPDIVELQQMLEKEQNINKEYYDKVTSIRKNSQNKKIRIMYQSAEEKLRNEEASILDDLDKELWEIS